MDQQLIKHLLTFLSKERADVIQKANNLRTRYITVVLEDIYESQNAGAVLRTCDCFGIQDVHIIENQNQFAIHPKVVRGATKWIDLHQHNQASDNSLKAITDLKDKGYRIVATSPHTNDVDIEQIDVTKGRIALFFGNEHNGISQVVKENADEFLKIPMYGFTESFNLSVSAAIILHHLVFRLKESKIEYYLSESEREELLLRWLKQAVKGSKYLIDEFNHKNQII
jgi:tRNA (guanosine-2'-O-)-methyltransferase